MKSNTSDLTVSDIASSATITISEATTVKTAMAQMQLADIRHLPVTDDSNRLVGILSDRDLLSAMAEHNGQWVRVADVMSKEVLFVRPDTRASEATALMLDKKIGALPVLDHDGSIVGIITETDFLRIIHRRLGGTTWP